MADDNKTKETTALEVAITSNRALRPRTREIYLNAVRLYLESAGTDPKKWTPRSVTNWRNKLVEEKLSAQTINLHVRGLQSATARWAAKDSAGVDFAKGLQPLPVEESRRKAKPLTVDQVQRILLTTNGDRPIDLRDRAMLLLGFRTGLRRSAIASVTFERFRGNLLTVDTKGGNTLTLAVDAEVTRAVRVWMTWLKRHGVTSGPLFRGLARPHVDGTVTIREGAVGVDNVTWIVRERAKQAGIKTDINLDVFRYTFRAWCQKCDIDPDRVRDVTRLTLEGVDVEVGEAIGNDLPVLWET